MDKETAATIRAWLKGERASVKGQNDGWSAGYRRAIQACERMIADAAKGDLQSIRDNTN